MALLFHSPNIHLLLVKELNEAFLHLVNLKEERAAHTLQAITKRASLHPQALARRCVAVTAKDANPAKPKCELPKPETIQDM